MKKIFETIKRWWPPVLLAGALVCLDQFSKAAMVKWAAGHPGESLLLWPGVLQLRLTHNEGVAFGLLQNGAVLPVLLPILALLLLPLLRRFVLPRGRLVDFAVAIVMAGGFSNLLDKLLRGYVVDFFEVLPFRFAIFNVADIYVTAGICLLVVAALLPATREKA